jgi:hypothetical protein
MQLWKLRLGAVLALAGGVSVGASDLPPARTRLVIRGTGAAREDLAPAGAKLDSQLRRMLSPSPAARAATTTFVPVSGPWQLGDAVRVRVRLAPGTAPDELARRGLTVERSSGNAVEGWVRTAMLPGLAAVAGVRFVAPARPGRVRTTADGAARADLARATGYDGTGVTVGVISDGAGALPATAVPSGCDAGSGSEGQALADVVHSLAPGATVLFASGLSSSFGFVDALHCLQAAGAKVIVDDLGFFDQPFFEDGSVAQAVRTAVQSGVSYHSAAGNEGASEYSAPFRPTPGSSYHDFADSGTPDNYDEIDVAPGQELDCILQWNDPFGASANDYDLEVYDMGTSTPTLVVASTNRQTGTEDPYEDFAVVNRGRTTGRAGVAVKRVSGVARVLKLFCFGGSNPELEYVTPAGSVIGHPAVREVVAVGAVDVSTPGLATVEAYSSQGPVDIYFPDRETRAKPDLVAFDGVTTVTPGFGLFYGTSAAAPDTAAVAALMLDKNACRSPAEIQRVLVSTAVDIGVPGVDSVAGAGRLDALAAVQAIPVANCRADADCDDGDPCTADTCEGCACVHGKACDDGDPCTVDTCDPTNACSVSPIEGYAGVACVCGRSLGSACASASLPRAVRRQFNRACRLVARAARNTHPAHVRSLVRRALSAFRLAGTRSSAAMERGTLAPGCAATLQSRITDARGRTEALRPR